MDILQLSSLLVVFSLIALTFKASKQTNQNPLQSMSIWALNLAAMVRLFGLKVGTGLCVVRSRGRLAAVGSELQTSQRKAEPPDCVVPFCLLTVAGVSVCYSQMGAC